MDRRYFKPKSLTWWASVVPLLAGVIDATEPLHGLASITQTVRSMTGDVSPSILINAGLAGIGLRGAMT